MRDAPPTMSRLILWRHGRTAWNLQRRFQGQADAPLDSMGVAQARAAAHHLTAESPDAIVSSDLARAADTAAELATLTGLPVRLDARLREHSLGRWEGLTREEVQRRYPEEFADWLAGRPGRRGGGELRSEVADRAASVLADLDVPVAVLVTHSATAIALTGYLLGLPEDQWRVVAPLANCHWSELRPEGTGWRLRSHNVSAVAPRTPPVPDEVAAAEKTEPEPADAEVLGPAAPDGSARRGEESRSR